jgi:hypothetical protein
MNKVNLFLDSGAFSAFSKGVEIKIEEYISFIKENESFIEVYANLDVIGDAEATLKNQRVMEKAGLKPLPCFHYGDDIKYLEIYLKEHKYIAFGGMVPISTPNLIKWLDHLFASYICDGKGIPKVKIHGFGLTSFDLMFRYPWFSVDSTSWVMTGRFGGVLIPKYKGGKFIYNEPPWNVSVSNQSSDIKEAGKHISTFAQMEKDLIIEYLKSKKIGLGKSEFKKVESKEYKLQSGERWAGKEEADAQRNMHGEEIRDGYVNKGYTEELLVETIIESGVSNDYRLRDEVNIIYYLDLEKEFPKWPWAFKLNSKTEGRKGFGFK